MFLCACLSFYFIFVILTPFRPFLKGSLSKLFDISTAIWSNEYDRRMRRMVCNQVYEIICA